MVSPKRILVCPLNWGLGHASRCIPLIRLLLEQGATIVLAGEGASLALLQQEFPELPAHTLPGIQIRYPQQGSMFFRLLFSIPSILRSIRREHTSLVQLVEKEKIDVVISDNRYGCYHPRIKSIFITHQLMIKSPFAEKMLHRIVLSYIRHYNECWIPDYEGSVNLSGDLSHKYPVPANCYFIGPLSRFNTTNLGNESSEKKQLLAIVSGPEPQRSIFAQQLKKQLAGIGQPTLLVLGLPEQQQEEQTGFLRICSHLDTTNFEKEFQRSFCVISRSGYSTIMDLHKSGLKAIFVPTPGQTEQEYLAEALAKNNTIVFQKQHQLDLATALNQLEKTTGFQWKGQEQNPVLLERIRILFTPFSGKM